ncbi:hypothetical protein [Bosea sp. (in: a-proteobacteria)]|jgi:hypothetical protein|uniref:hypothetical protein n=1 Tax=Bosea sp. (in: a-proteobacteria) TaxID=1871050 RepID=UPI002734B520|nr:hypothetical protein [Bosea sp. (in: a-proteobacteria)]MDP3411528.1 hypothetical protein [Bosea sp. (in: a-proteobacteria)]
MISLSSRILARKRAWQRSVSLSASLLIRDHGPSADLAARALRDSASAEANDLAVRFWSAVEEEIAIRAGAET